MTKQTSVTALKETSCLAESHEDHSNMLQ